MDVFFIRHGETEYNRRSIHQPIDAPLNELGIKQAEAAAPIIAALRPTHLISSTHRRASETAEIINETLNMPLLCNDRFGELLRPKSIRGMRFINPRSLWYLTKWFFATDQSKWDEHDAESRPQFLERIREAKAHLETMPSDARIVVVTHSVFTHFFVEHICNDEPISFVKATLLLLKLKKLKNTSIVHMTYKPDIGENLCKWNLVVFDDDSHVVT